ncbi:MAG: TonB family protein [Pseudomonadota bacterium]
MPLSAKRPPGRKRGPARAKPRAAAKRQAKKPTRSGNAYASNWRGAVARKILRQRMRAKSSRGAGISITVSASAALAGARVTRSSGNARFDREALAAVRRAAPFPRTPSGGRMTLSITIKWRGFITDCFCQD